MKLKLVIVMACALLMTVISQAEENTSTDSNVDTTSESTVSGKTSEAGRYGKETMHKAGFEMGRHYTVLTFNRGSNELTAADKANLRALVEKAKETGAIERVRVVAWSDKPFPTGKAAADLPKSDRDLATARINKIEEFLEKDLGVQEIKAFSMAERANWFARAFNTTEAELKSIFARKGAEHEASEEQLRVIKQRGGPMKAVIVIQERMAAHGTESGVTSGTTSEAPIAPTTPETDKRSGKGQKDQRHSTDEEQHEH